MNQELQNELFEKYPEIFAEKDLDMSVTCMCWGIETGDGWYKLLDSLCANLDHSMRNGHPQVVATQVKEKFGDLRFYVDNADEYQRGMITLAETMSECTCETCGAIGTMKADPRGWVSTLCDDCRSGNTTQKLKEHLNTLISSIDIGRSHVFLQEKINEIKLELSNE